MTGRRKKQLTPLRVILGAILLLGIAVLGFSLLLHGKEIAVLNPQGIIAKQQKDLMLFTLLLSVIVAVVKNKPLRTQKLLQPLPDIEIRQIVKTEMRNAAIDPVIDQFDIVIDIETVIPFERDIDFRGLQFLAHRREVAEAAFIEDDAEAVHRERNRLPLLGMNLGDAVFGIGEIFGIEILQRVRVQIRQAVIGHERRFLRPGLPQEIRLAEIKIQRVTHPCLSAPSVAATLYRDAKSFLFRLS